MLIENSEATFEVNIHKEEDRRNEIVVHIDGHYAHPDVILEIETLVSFQWEGKTFVKDAGQSLMDLLRELIKVDSRSRGDVDEHEIHFEIQISEGRVVFKNNKIFLREVSFVLKKVISVKPILTETKPS